MLPTLLTVLASSTLVVRVEHQALALEADWAAYYEPTFAEWDRRPDRRAVLFSGAPKGRAKRGQTPSGSLVDRPWLAIGVSAKRGQTPFGALCTGVCARSRGPRPSGPRR